MTKDESIQLFQSGKEAWNAWATEVLARQDDSNQWKAEARVNFSSHVFGNADFSGFVFPGRAEFSDVQFMGNSWFIGASFNDTATFENAIFNNEICFIESAFKSMAIFEGAIFKGDTHFGKSVFQKAAVFRKATYYGAADFINCLFDDLVLCTDTTFHRYAMFSKTRFRGAGSYFESKFKEGATFEYSVFTGNVNFRDSVFEGISFFSNAQFKSDVTFGGFSEVVRFEHAVFDGEAWFAKCTFDKIARFDGTTFNKGARFEDCTFRGDVAFSASCFVRYATFDRIKCHGQVSFQGVEARSAFTMAGASFSKVPIFYQATFSEAPRLDNVSIQPANRKGIARAAVWNRLKGSSDTSFSTRWRQLKAQGNEAAVRWRTLRRLASQGHDHQRKMLFFREEVLSSRWISDKPWQAYFWFGLLYQLFSDFGRSLSRPILWWLIWWKGFSLVYFALQGRYKETQIPETCSHVELVEPWIASVGLSLHRSLPALSGLSDRIGVFQRSLFGVSDRCLALVPNTISFLGVLQTVVATALLFLVLLAIRNRFLIR